MQVRPASKPSTENTWYGVVSSGIDAGLGYLAMDKAGADTFFHSDGGPAVLAVVGVVGHSVYGVWSQQGARQAATLDPGFPAAAHCISLGEFCKAGGYAAIQFHQPGLGLGLMLAGSALSIVGGRKADAAMTAMKHKEPAPTPDPPQHR